MIHNRMFKKATLFISFLSVLILGCSNDGDSVEPDLIVAKNEMTFGKNQSTQQLAIKTNVKWSLSSSQTWCTLSPSSGEAGTIQIEVTVSANPDTESRDAVITVEAGGITKTVDVIQSASDFLSLKKTEYPGIPQEGQEITVSYDYSAVPQITINDSWIKEKVEGARVITTGSKTFTVEANTLKTERTGTITFAVGDLTETVTITQQAKDISIPADKTGMASDALALAAKIKLGWNLGNSLEAYGNNVPNETAWGNPATTKAMIDMVKAAGFNAVRIPCAWNGYIEDDDTYKIADSWMTRVKEVVDYCIDNDMYAILNIHWDGGWLEENPTFDKQVENNLRQEALWEQIAVAFRNYDEHLLFAGTNEVHQGYGEPTAENIEVQLSYNQTFIDAVRSTGGRNTWRNLIVQAYNTNIAHAVKYLEIPEDPTANRLMVEVHYYDPWGFCGDENSNEFLWGQVYTGSANVSGWGQESWVQEQFGAMKTNFVDKGYPVILGEYGAIKRTSLTGEDLRMHNESRNHYLEYITAQARKYGLVPFYWDNGYIGNNTFALFNRNELKIYDDDAVNALVRGVNSENYPF